MAYSGDTAPAPADRPETGGGEFDLDRLSRLAIDQVILDGMVDDRGRRVHITELALVAFPETHAPEPVYEEFRGALAEDERYVDQERNRYRYTPVVDADTEAAARPIAIIKGKALVSREVQRATFRRMDAHLRAIYDTARSRGTTRLSIDEVGESLRDTGGAELTPDELRGLRYFLKKDHRQWLTKDGLLILGADGDGAPDLLPRSADVHNFGPLIAETMSRLRETTGADVFTTKTLIGVLRKTMGVYLERHDANMLIRQLAAQPYISPYGQDRFRITGEPEIPEPAS